MLSIANPHVPSNLDITIFRDLKKLLLLAYSYANKFTITSVSVCDLNFIPFFINFTFNS